MPSFGKPSKGIPPHQLVTIFEAANDTLREIYIGVSEQLIDALIQEFRAHPPKAVAHWDKNHQLSFRCLEYSIPARDAASFIENYAASNALKKWTVVWDRQ